MNFLIDTNIVIPLEPTSKQDLEVNTDLALKFHNLSSGSGNKIFIHPAIKNDIQRDKNKDRKELRETLIARYPYLPSPPPVSTLDSSIIPHEQTGTNSWVDNSLLAAVQGNLVDYLVTEDIGIHRKAKRLGIDSRILLLSDAIALVEDLFDISTQPPPTVEKKYVHELDSSDDIFNSLRLDYGGKKFDTWLIKCKRDHRDAYVVRSVSGEIAGIVILKREDSLPNGVKGKILKICTFKVSASHGGNRLGELLLKPVFDYIKYNQYEYAYFTAFPKQKPLIAFAGDFGFEIIENKDSPSEIALCKTFSFAEDDLARLSPLDFHIRYGPRITSFLNNKAFIVPIRPTFHLTLFPEIGATPVSMFGTPQKPCGNSIRKAYLCNSSIKKIAEGDNLFFYRSKDLSSLTSLGIVEATMTSKNVSDVARFVGKRTVYSYKAIEKMCDKNNVLAILFRHVCAISPHIPLRKLRSSGIMSPKGQPQSITEITGPGIKWLRQQIKM